MDYHGFVVAMNKSRTFVENTLQKALEIYKSIPPSNSPSPSYTIGYFKKHTTMNGHARGGVQDATHEAKKIEQVSTSEVKKFDLENKILFT